MTNIVVLCHERYRLTMQCIDSIRSSTKDGTYTLTLVDDDSQDFRVQNYLRDQALYHPKDTTSVFVMSSNHILGGLKNLGIGASLYRFGTPEYLCVMDNDVCVFPGWLETLEKTLIAGPCRILGGVRHPFHGVNKKHKGWDETDAVAGYCHFMEYLTYAIQGPYVHDAPGIGQSEDFAICQRTVNDGLNGGPVGYLNPPVMTHCGITNSKGKPIDGADQIERVPGVLYL